MTLSLSGTTEAEKTNMNMKNLLDMNLNVVNYKSRVKKHGLVLEKMSIWGHLAKMF